MLKRITRTSLLAFAVFLFAPVISFATDYYVSSNGSGNGSIGSPWSIGTLCGGSSQAQPGDTVWLRGGNYGSGGSSTINCQLNGSSSAPIIVRAYPGERATILGGLGIYSNYVWYWGIEIQNSFTRSTSECGSFPSIKPPDGVFFSQGATGNKFINMIIHDVANGISDQQEAIGTEDYGNLLYNIGWASSCDRGHGHALYLQNNGSAVKLVQDNLGWNSFDIGMQAYSGAASVSNIWFVGNAFWNNGLPGGHRVDNMYIGDSATPKQNILIQDSVMYNPLDASSGETGYNEANSGSSIDITLKNNYWIGASPTGYVTLLMTGWQTTNVTGNMFVGPLSVSGIGSYNWSGNSYYKSSPPSGADGGSPVSGSYPTGVRVVVRPNKYEQGRAHIIVMNFDKASTVNVDLSGTGLTSGQSYEIRDAQNFWGGAVATGTYNGGSISLPMNLSAVTPMINYTTPGHTSAEFGAFVVLPTSGATSISTPGTPAPPASAPPAPAPPAPAPTTANGGVSGSWSFDTADISGSTVMDGSGNGLNGVLFNTAGVAGRVNEALSFNGINSVVTINSSSKLDLVNNMTISAWIKTTNNSRTEDFLGKYDASASEWGYILKTLPSGVIALRVGGNNTAGARDLADTTPINDGQWHHVAVVINLGSSVQFYIDGSLRTTQGLPTIAAGNSAALSIGTLPFNYFGNPFTGSLDGVRIDAQALSASAIATIVGNAGGTVSSGGTTTPVAVSITPVGATLNAGQTQLFTATVVGSTNTAVAWSLNPAFGTIQASGFYTAPASISSQQPVTVTATSLADSSKSASVTVTLIPTATATAPSGGVAGWWSFDTTDISGSTALDGSGNGLNGILSNTTVVSGKVNQALSFNGSSSVVTVPSNSKLDLLNSMTLSAWVKTTNNSRTEDFLGKYDASGSELGYILKVLPAGAVALRIGGNNTNSVRDVADTTAINDGQWHHVAVVINLGSNVQFYIDGALRSTQSMLTKAGTNAAPLWIGTIPFNYFGNPFTGSLDTVRVDAQALSASAIATLASGATSTTTTTTTSGGTTSSGSTNVSGAAGSWSLDAAEISGTTVLDGSGNGLNGVLSNTTAVTGRVNQALSFNGSNSVVTVPSSPKLDLVNGMTLSAWVRTTNNSRTEDFIGKYDATGTEWGYILKTLPSGVVGLRVGGSNVVGTRDVADTTAINDGQWHHVAAVINLGQNVQFYIDGTLRSTQPMVTVAAGNAAPLWIGTIPFNYFGNPFTGSLDSVKIFNQALSGSVVAQLAQ
jgi:hypothetical protein